MFPLGAVHRPSALATIMNGPLNKRQQARNEKTLQDLVQKVPGNNVCADCQTRNPGQCESTSTSMLIGLVLPNPLC